MVDLFFFFSRQTKVYYEISMQLPLAWQIKASPNGLCVYFFSLQLLNKIFKQHLLIFPDTFKAILIHFYIKPLPQASHE